MFTTKLSQKPDNKAQLGFSLIEIIVVLIMVGVLAAVGGMAIVQAMRGYMAVKENSTTTQKAQLAMSRINREIIEMVSIPSDASATVLPIVGTNGCSGTNCTRTIGLNNGALKIALGTADPSGGDILIDNVTAFSLTYNYCSSFNGQTTSTTTWPAANDDSTLASIDISMQVTPPGGSPLTFNNRVGPRNNSNHSCATSVPPPPSGMGLGTSTPTCFVATAAYGDAGHPMVQILRDFRDRYLLASSTGRWLVRKYYLHGPAVADFIRNRPFAMWAVRCLLAPVVALSFCLLYAPLAIPFIFVISLIMTLALFRAIKRGFAIRSDSLRSQGSILIGIIITMVIMAVLAAAMLPLFSASYLNQAYADQSRRAYFLAESGYRYASSQFLWAGTAGRNAAMTELNGGSSGGGKTCNLLNSAGSFTTLVYPYWFSTNVATAGATTLTTTVYGTRPAEFGSTLSAGYIRVGSASTSYSYYSYSSGSGSGTTITFSGLSPSLPATAAGLDVQPVTYPGSNQTFSKGGNLTLSATGSGVFPLLNANIILNGITYHYSSRTGTTLYNITKTTSADNTNWTTSVSVTTSQQVILDKFVRLSSTGNSGSASRTIIYNVPVGWITGAGGTFQKRQSIDTFDTQTSFNTNWSTSVGTFQIATIDSSPALDVTNAPSSSSPFCQANWAVAYLNWSGNPNTNLAQAWLDAQGDLSYDLQVKIHNDQPNFIAGLNFRTVNNNNNTKVITYGVSFVKPRIERACGLCTCHNFWKLSTEQDILLIPGWVNQTAFYSLTSGPLLPMSGPNLLGDYDPAVIESTSICGNPQYAYGYPAIVLWEQDSNGCKWLAYRKLVAADGVVTNPSGYQWRLVDWSTLMVRVNEGASLTFSAGNTGTPIKEGDIISNAASNPSKNARVVMTPILTAGSWTSGSPAVGTLVLADVNPPSGNGPYFQNGDGLYVNGSQRATAVNYTGQKKNYIRVYFGHPSSIGTANTVETDNNRLANPRGSANWPPDDLRDLNSSNDYMTLVQWTDCASGSNNGTQSCTGQSGGIQTMTSTSEPNAIIVDSLQGSPNWNQNYTVANFVGPNGVSAGDNFAISASGDTATSTYFDDYAVQLDLIGGTGFLTPIQQ